MSKKKGATIMVLMLTATVGGCANMRSFFALNNGAQQQGGGPIQNPFGNYMNEQKDRKGESIVLRTKKGERSVEVELPKSNQDMTDFVIPVAPAFHDATGGGGGRTIASLSGATAGPGETGSAPTDDTYKDRPLSTSDREILANMPQGLPEDEAKRREVEQGLGLVPTDDNTPDHDKSYLAAVDHIKQLYKLGRYEAGLLEVDELIKTFQTDPHLYQMRGTLLDRLGRTDLAIKAWKQALRFDEKNNQLRRFIERREQRMGVSAP